MDSEVLLWNTCAYLSDRDLYSLSQTCKSVYVGTQHTYTLQSLWLARCERKLECKLNDQQAESWRVVYYDLLTLSKKRSYMTVRSELSILLYLDKCGRLSKEVLEAAIRGGHARAVERYLPIMDGSVLMGQVMKSALASSAKSGHIEVFEVLLSDQEARKALNYDKLLSVAAAGGRIELVLLLLPRTNNLIRAVENYLWTATLFKQTEVVVTTLLSHLQVTEGYLHDLIVLASRKNNKDTLSLLLSDPRADPTWRNCIAITEARETESKECLDLLLAHPRSERARQEYEDYNKKMKCLGLLEVICGAALMVGSCYLLYRDYQRTCK